MKHVFGVREVLAGGRAPIECSDGGEDAGRVKWFERYAAALRDLEPRVLEWKLSA